MSAVFLKKLFSAYLIILILINVSCTDSNQNASNHMNTNVHDMMSQSIQNQDQTPIDSVHDMMNMMMTDDLSDMRREALDMSLTETQDQAGGHHDFELDSTTPHMTDQAVGEDQFIVIRSEDDHVVTMEAPDTLTRPIGTTERIIFPIKLTELHVPVQGWSFTLIAQPHSLCRITQLISDESISASVEDTPPGLLQDGFSTASVVETEHGNVAMSAIIFSLQNNVVLLEDQIDRALVRVELEIDFEDGDSNTCSVRFAPDIPVNGRLVSQSLSSNGQSLPLFLLPASIEIQTER